MNIPTCRNPIGFYLDSSISKLYCSCTGDSILALTTSGSAQGAFTLLTPPGTPIAYTMGITKDRANDGTLYVGTKEKGIIAIALGAGNMAQTTVVTASSCLSGAFLAWDSYHQTLYAACTGGAPISYTPSSGSVTTLLNAALAPGSCGIFRNASIGSPVYIAAGGGDVLSVDVDNNTPTVGASLCYAPNSIIHDGGNLYSACGSGLAMIDNTGIVSRLLSPTQCLNASSLALDANNVGNVVAACAGTNAAYPSYAISVTPSGTFSRILSGDTVYTGTLTSIV
jgi:hypothetical protein